MTVTLYIYSGDSRVVNKTLQTVKTVNAQPTENVNILNPSLILENDGTIISANYMYIQEFNRYYFINTVDIIRGRRVIIRGTIDVLKTYADSIKNCTAIITRAENIGRPTYIIDKSLPINPNKKELLTAKKDFTVRNGNIYLVRVKDSTIKYNRE